MNHALTARKGTKKLFSEGHSSLRSILQELLVIRTEQEVADLLGMSVAWVSSRMVGARRNRPCHKGSLRKIANGLGLPVEQVARLVSADLQNSCNG
jgi:hypothetical protein